MGVSATALSRVLAHALRHQPWLYELELDSEGWVRVEQLLDALREKGGGWASVDRGDLVTMLATSAKRRYELSGDRIRALYGHSLPGVIRKAPAPPPATLFHGTARQTWPRVRSGGLRPMGRQYVHLSVDVATARSVGGRKSDSPLVLRVDAAGAHGAGVAFYAGNEMVWLADRVPVEFLTVLEEDAR